MSSYPSAAETPTRVRYWVIVFAAALAVVTYIDRVALSFAATDISHDLGLNFNQMGAALSAFAFCYALFEIPCGYLGDRIGPRNVLTRIVLWWSFFTAAMGWIWSLGSLIATQGLFGAGEAGCFPNLTKAFTTWLPPRERARAQSIIWLSARWGGAFTPPLVALVMGLVGWRHAFQIFGCLGVVWAIVFYRWFRNNPLDNPKLNAAEREMLRGSAKLATGHGDVPWRKLVTSTRVWMLCWQYFCLSYGWYFYITWLPTYLRKGRGLDIPHSALFGILPLFMGGLGNPVGALATAAILRRTGNLAFARKLVSCIGFAGAAGFLVLSTTVRDPLFAMLAIGTASFCNDLVMPGAWSAAMDIGGKYAGTVSGSMNMWGNLGGAVCPFAIGHMLTWTSGNWNLTFYVSAAIYMLGIVFWLLIDPVTPLESAPLELPVEQPHGRAA